MAIATWNGRVLAQSDQVVEIEGNIYFPSSALEKSYFIPSASKTHCPWKGDASYYSIQVDGETLADAAWYYPAPYEKAASIKDHVAFWKGVLVER